MKTKINPKLIGALIFILIIVLSFILDNIRTNNISNKYAKEYPPLTIEKEANGFISFIRKEDLKNFKSNPYEAGIVINDSIKLSITAKDLTHKWMFDEYLTLGDQIRKKKGSDEIYIFRIQNRDTLKYVFKLYELK
jgi:hypothetical protein